MKNPTLLFQAFRYPRITSTRSRLSQELASNIYPSTASRGFSRSSLRFTKNRSALPLINELGQLVDKKWLAASVISFLAAMLLSKSPYISVALSLLIFGIGIIRAAGERARNSHKLDDVWPEVIDHLIAGIQSGMSLTESFIGLEDRGPIALRALIATAAHDLKIHGDFDMVLESVKSVVASPACDQICEAIALSRALGGNELIYVLRTLGDYLRADLATRREIEVKHGWIKNSAHLSAIAPWLLLLLLSTQPSTAQAFSTPTGISILVCGVIATCVAYLWMNFLAKLPRAPRIFSLSDNEFGVKR